MPKSTKRGLPVLPAKEPVGLFALGETVHRQQAGVQDTDVAKRIRCDSPAMTVRAEAAETNDNLRGTSRMAQVA